MSRSTIPYASPEFLHEEARLQHLAHRMTHIDHVNVTIDDVPSIRISPIVIKSEHTPKRREHFQLGAIELWQRLLPAGHGQVTKLPFNRLDRHALVLHDAYDFKRLNDALAEHLHDTHQRQHHHGPYTGPRPVATTTNQQQQGRVGEMEQQQAATKR